MRSRQALLIQYCSLIVIVSSFCLATTWSPVKVKCPYCGTKSVYYSIKSYGTYIYDYPSKYEYVFWPYIDGKVLYCCRKCWFTCFAWDFFSIPEGRREGIRKVLSRMAVFETSGDYEVVPMYYRLQIAESIYMLYDKDDEFWCHFYRVKGYHCDIEGKSADAAEARRKALECAARMIADPVNAGMGKELFYVQGAMQYLINEIDSALASFRYAQQLEYNVPDMDSLRLKNINQYLGDLIDRYIEKIEQTK